ncbi:MAG: hypothetical protein ABGX12_02745 [Desulfurobacteriaceae bacterium]
MDKRVKAMEFTVEIVKSLAESGILVKTLKISDMSDSRVAFDERLNLVVERLNLFIGNLHRSLLNLLEDSSSSQESEKEEYR